MRQPVTLGSCGFAIRLGRIVMKPSEIRRIALVVPVEWEYSLRITAGVLTFLDEYGGYQIRDFRFSDPNFEPPTDLATWGGWHPNGVVCSVGTAPGLADWLIASGLPMVNTSTDISHKVIPAVHGTGAGKLAVEHLVSLGFRNIAYVSQRTSSGPNLLYKSVAKFAGAADCSLLSHELEGDPVGGTNTKYQEVASEPGLIEFLKSAPKPLAVVAMNDDFARCVCLACHGLGLAIPDQVAVVGLDDSSVARLNTPPLSSVQTPGERVGYTAMKLLDSLLNGEQPPSEPIRIPCQSIAVRESTQKNEGKSIDRALRLIEAEACKGLSVDDLARFLGMSRSSFEKRFAAEIGRTPGQEIRRVKLETAKKLLGETRLSVTHISEMVGFSRSSVFGSFFKKQEGMTPTAYRRLQIAQ